MMTGWLSIKDGNPQAADIYARHYSARQYADKRREHYGYRNRWLIVGPGEKLLLMTAAYDALFVWRKFIDASGQHGINCAVYRNESMSPGSGLLFEAELLALRKWPDADRFYTYINPREVKGNPPGNVFLRAGWKRCGITKWNKLWIYEKYVTRAERSAAVLMEDL
jgi:hypothetical protein